MPAERLGDEVGRALRAEIESGANLDVHAADQLLVYAALANGPSSFTVRTVRPACLHAGNRQAAAALALLQLGCGGA